MDYASAAAQEMSKNTYSGIRANWQLRKICQTVLCLSLW
jgi:hypothetical protein